MLVVVSRIQKTLFDEIALSGSRRVGRLKTENEGVGQSMLQTSILYVQMQHNIGVVFGFAVTAQPRVSQSHCCVVRDPLHRHTASPGRSDW